MHIVMGVAMHTDRHQMIVLLMTGNSREHSTEQDHMAEHHKGEHRAGCTRTYAVQQDP